MLPPFAKKLLEKGRVDDLVLLDTLTEDAIVKNLENRFQSDHIYSAIGSVLISVNPFRQINGMYSQQMVKAYHGAYSYERSPHIYGISEEAFKNLLSTGRNQCILVSGESGAGKTEAVKHILNYISAVSKNESNVGKSVQLIKEKLLESNPVMEAFGNAKTLRNDNSSRFGKYAVVQFDYAGAPLGCFISTYLLEKPRIIQQQSGERNFHIFYNLVYGLKGNLRSELSLGSPSDYKYLGETLQVPGINDEADFGEVNQAMDGLLGEERKNFLFAIVAGVLHLGNITFTTNGGKETPSQDALNKAAKCFEVDANKLKDALTNRTIKTRGETMISPLRKEECVKTKDALAKSIYARAFKALVSFLNEALKTPERVELTLGLLDVFGFEIFAKNSFEQLLINYCNERLQFLFITLTLDAEQREYEVEAIQWNPIPFFNNQIVCELIDGKKPAGILAFIDEEVIMPGGNDRSFLNKINSNLKAHKHFEPLTKDAKKGDATEFMIHHYAGDVIYSSQDFVEKNQDTLYRDLIEMCGTSKNSLVKSLYPEANEAHDMKKPITVFSQFKIDLDALIGNLMKTDPHYVRCIKPNDQKQSGNFDHERVAHQVRYLGLLENVKVRRAGFAFRQTYKLFVHRYNMICPEIWLKKNHRPDGKKDAKAILDSMAIGGEGESFAMGKTKIFIRRPETLFQLEEMRERKLNDVAMMIQNAFRGYKARKYFLELREKSMGIFQGKKRRRNSWVLFFQGDYIFAKDSLELKSIFEHPNSGGHDRQIVFADRCDVMAKKNQLEPRHVVFTEKSIYVTDLKWKQARRIDLRMVRSFDLSTFADGFVVIKVNQPQPGKATEADLVLHTLKKAELATVMSEKSKMQLNFNDKIEFSYKKVGLFSSKILLGNLTFTESSSTKFFQLQMNPGDYSNVTVLISPSLGSKAPMQLSGSAPERAIANLAGRAAAGFIDHSNKAKMMRGKGEKMTETRPKSDGNALVGSSMVPLSDLSGKKKIKVLYDYKGSNQKDLNVFVGDMLFLIESFSDGWIDVQSEAGKRGLIPGSYVEAM